MTDTIFVITSLGTTSLGELVPKEVIVLARHGDWALVKHADCDYRTVTHVPSGLALAFVPGYREEAAKIAIESLPLHPVGLGVALPQTIRDAVAMCQSATLAPQAAELHTWVRNWRGAGLDVVLP